MLCPLRDTILSLLQLLVPMSTTFTFQTRKRRLFFLQKKFGFVQYKILLIFRPAISIVVFEIVKFI